jgi:arabinofuranosyltransferase
MKKFYYILQFSVLGVFAISCVYFAKFTAEDAFITYRYAENWINTGSLVYNTGEPINAMTSPFHAIFSAAIFQLTGNTVLGNKIVAVILLLLSALIVWNQFRDSPRWQMFALVLVLLPPSVILWTFGGLETPLLLFLVTVTVSLANREPPFKFGLVCAVFLLAGLGLLTRYDSVLFFVPLTVYVAFNARSVKYAVIGALGAGFFVLSWLSISFLYYGDLLPTSYYVKTPILNLSGLFFNGVYISSYLLFVGLLPVLLLSIFLIRPKHSVHSFLYTHIKTKVWLYTGLLLELLYGLTIATHHMMFSFRFFVPYIPAAAILVVDLLRRASEISEVDSFSGRPARLFTGFLLCLMLFQIYQNVYTYRRSVNGLSMVGEYRSLGLEDYARFIQVLKQEALDIEKHWDLVGGAMNRRPRVMTFAAGMLPYTYKDAYIYEKLVSYRHCYQRQNQGLHADYLHILAPRLGQVDEQLPGPDDRYTMVSSYELYFDGSKQTFLVYYNPNPEENNISAKIYEPCQQLEEAKGQINVSTEK